MPQVKVSVRIEGFRYSGVVPEGRGAADGFLFLRGEDDLPKSMVVYELFSIRDMLKEMGFSAWVREGEENGSPYLLASHRSVEFFQESFF